MDYSKIVVVVIIGIIWEFITIARRKKARHEALARQAALLKQSETKDMPG